MGSPRLPCRGLSQREAVRRTRSRTATAYAPQGRSASVRSYRLGTRLDPLPQSGQHAVIRRA